MSDSHVVASHAVSPALTRPLLTHRPSPAPTTLIREDPVPAPLRICTPLIDPRSAVSNDDRLPARRPTLSTARKLPPAIDPTRQRADVSAAHHVCSHPVCPDLARPVHPLVPMLAPCIVTILAPVDLALPAATLSPATSTDIAAVLLPTLLPTLIHTRKLP